MHLLFLFNNLICYLQYLLRMLVRHGESVQHIFKLHMQTVTAETPRYIPTHKTKLQHLARLKNDKNIKKKNGNANTQITQRCVLTFQVIEANSQTFNF